MRKVEEEFRITFMLVERLVDMNSSHLSLN